MTAFVRKYIQGIVFLLVLTAAPSLRAETRAEDSGANLEDLQLVLAVREKMGDYIEYMQSFEATVKESSPDAYPDLLKRYNVVKVRWNTYYNSYLVLIADHDELMESVSEYDALNESVQTLLSELQTKQKALESFEDAVQFIEKQDTLYQNLYERAQLLSATSKTAGELEKLKGKEQLVFSEVQEKFDAACQAAEIIPTLSSRMDRLNEKYIVLKCISEKIQQTAYKPLIERLKDYLMSIAAVALILMFVSMLRSKMKAAKQLRENAQKTLDEYRKNKDDIPNI